MTDLTPDHPAVMAATSKYLTTRRGNGVHAVIAAALTAAIPHLTAADLRNTPAGRALMAEAWEEGARATNRAWDHAHDGHPVDPDFPYYECQACDTANPHREAHHD